VTPEVDALRHRLLTLVRAADRLRSHAGDLHGLGWEPHVGEALEGDASGFESSPPRAGDPRARRLFEKIAAEAARAEAELVGLERSMLGLFVARTERPDPSRGSTIRVEEFDDQLARQRRRSDTPVRLEPQPQHPGRRP
jgi:hypothetical protein